jgi:hypothetical protein
MGMNLDPKLRARCRSTMTPGDVTNPIPVKQRRRRRGQTGLEKEFWSKWKLLYPDLVFAQEFPFHPTRKWRFDFAFPILKVAVECQGGIFRAGRHTRGVGYRKDRDKRQAAEDLGWRVYYIVPGDLAYPVQTLEPIAMAIRERMGRANAR